MNMGGNDVPMPDGGATHKYRKIHFQTMPFVACVFFRCYVALYVDSFRMLVSTSTPLVDV